MDQCWVKEGKDMVPKVSPLVETFLAATGSCIPPHVIRQCWPVPCNETPVQDLTGIKEHIVKRLEVMIHTPSNTTWDRFAFPKTDQKYWREEVLCHHPGKVLDVGTWILGFRVMLQNYNVRYSSMAHVLKIEGSMLIYDLQRDIAQWVPVRGGVSFLTMMKLRSANDLNNMSQSPYKGTEPIQPSPALVKGIPMGAESDSDTFKEDSGEELNKKECGNWSRCPSPPLRMGPTCVEVQAMA